MLGGEEPAEAGEVALESLRSLMRARSTTLMELSVSIAQLLVAVERDDGGGLWSTWLWYRERVGERLACS